MDLLIRRLSPIPLLPPPSEISVHGLIVFDILREPRDLDYRLHIYESFLRPKSAAIEPPDMDPNSLHQHGGHTEDRVLCLRSRSRAEGVSSMASTGMERGKSKPTFEANPILGLKADCQRLLPPDKEDESLTGSFPFLKLPGELRNRIYKEYFSKPCVLIMHLPKWSTAICHVSRQCHEEAVPFYYSITVFKFRLQINSSNNNHVEYDESDRFRKCCGPERLALVKDVSLMCCVDVSAIWDGLGFLDRYLQVCPGLECLRVTVLLGTRRQENVARAEELAETLPPARSDSPKWIRRWVVDEICLHFWYVPKKFEMTRWVSASFAVLWIRATTNI